MKTILSILFLFFFINNKAQSSKLFVYERSLRFPESAVDQLFKEVQEERDEETPDSVVQKMKHDFLKMLSSALPQTDSLYVYRTAQQIVMKEHNMPTVTKTYHLDSLLFSSAEKSSKDSSIRPYETKYSMDWRKQAGWQVQYKVVKKKDTKSLLGYKCQLFEVTQIKQTPVDDKIDSTVYQLWLTDKIMPAIPAYAVLGWYECVLPQFTMLEAQITSMRMSGAGEFVRLNAIR